MKKLVMFIVLLSLFFLNQGYTAPLDSSLKDQQDVAVTIYNSNIGLVKDTRLIHLGLGITELKFMDVAAKIDPTSVHIQSLVENSSLNVLEQNYEYDLLNPQTSRKVRRPKCSTRDPEPRDKKEEIVEAILLSTQGGISFRSETRSPSAIRAESFSRIPENLIPQPTLVWLLIKEAFPASKGGDLLPHVWNELEGGLCCCSGSIRYSGGHHGLGHHRQQERRDVSKCSLETGCRRYSPGSARAESGSEDGQDRRTRSQSSVQRRGIL